MTTYSANAVASTVQSRGGSDITSVTSSHTVATALVAGDILQLAKVPKNAVIQEVIVSCSGSLGSTFTAEFGDGGDTDRLITSGTFGQGAASLTRLNAHTGHGYSYTDEDTIDMKVNTAASGTTGVVINSTVIYSLNSKLS